VFIELLRLQLERVDLEIYYWKRNGKEVDFVLKEGFSVINLIQVCWDIANPKTKKRERDNLSSAMDEFELESGLILTGNYEDVERINSKTIQYVPLWKFLMDIGQFL